MENIAENIEEKKVEKVKSDSDSDKEEEQSPEEKALWEKIDAVLKEYHLTAF